MFCAPRIQFYLCFLLLVFHDISSKQSPRAHAEWRFQKPNIPDALCPETWPPAPTQQQLHPSSSVRAYPRRVKCASTHSLFVPEHSFDRWLPGNRKSGEIDAAAPRRRCCCCWLLLLSLLCFLFSGCNAILLSNRVIVTPWMPVGL